ncbi:hypothetical protein Y032_0006g2857 [Ancylostoma ceylanicum]|uniref:ShKT domain-containing protein n=1 Tax=Ancylostoma ceylanicum TaxID=53326 RepID=A0A016VNR5_9BILA|nr:hypothetical protein Y032_0006g2857 [Ancylostoma ceylanicum]
MLDLLCVGLVVFAQLSTAQFHRRRLSVIQPGFVRSRTFSRLHESGREHNRTSTLDSSRALPCCQDESGGAVCRTVRTNNPDEFLRKCNTEPDFSLVVCCKACNDVTVSHRERGALFFNTQNDSSLCFDRMSSSYCSRFQSSSDAWSGKRWSCNSEHFRLAFRVCRQSCGFCTMDWRKSPEPLKCT